MVVLNGWAPCLLLAEHSGLEALGGEGEGPAEVDSQGLVLELLS